MSKILKNNLPTYDELMIPVLQSLKSLGGSATIDELNEEVFSLINLSDEQLQIPHAENDSRSEIEYRLAWTRTYLKKFGLIDNSKRGVWALNDADLDIKNISPDDIVKHVKDEDRKNRQQKTSKEHVKKINDLEEHEQEDEWKHELLETLSKIEPDAFERLAQRILRESGFVQVEVMGRSGDGGIDGKGILKVGGLLSFHIIFQCKRYQGSVSPSQIRDFRGAMQGRADKGLFITTGTFTREALKEATRDGAPPIDLIDGDQLCDKLKELDLGVKTELVESVKIVKEWFDKL